MLSSSESTIRGLKADGWVGGDQQYALEPSAEGQGYRGWRDTIEIKY